VYTIVVMFSLAFICHFSFPLLVTHTQGEKVKGSRGKQGKKSGRWKGKSKHG